MILVAWLVGFAVSLLVGGLVTWAFLKVLRNWMRLPAKPALSDPSRRRVPPWLMGTIERTFFTIAVGANVSGALPTMAGWIALKLAANWSNAKNNATDPTLWATSALLAGLVSMGFAMVGGLIAANPEWLARVLACLR